MGPFYSTRRRLSAKFEESSLVLGNPSGFGGGARSRVRATFLPPSPPPLARCRDWFGRSIRKAIAPTPRRSVRRLPGCAPGSSTSAGRSSTLRDCVHLDERAGSGLAGRHKSAFSQRYRDGRGYDQEPFESGSAPTRQVLPASSICRSSIEPWRSFAARNCSITLLSYVGRSTE